MLEAPPSPSAPPTSPTTPAAPPSGAREPAGSEAFGAIDAMGVEDGKPDPEPRLKPATTNPAKPAAQPPRNKKDGQFAPKTTTTATKPATAEKPPEKPATAKPEANPDEAPTEVEDKPAAGTPPAEPQAPKQLREAYEALKAKHKTLEAEHTALKTKASAPPPVDPEKKALSEKLTAREKRLAEIEDELRFADYARSDDYKERYEKPFVQAFMNGRAKVASLKIPAKVDPDTGEISQASRQATAEDFDALMRITDDDAAAEWAAEMFGPKASMVLFHRERVQELNLAGTKAIEEYRKNGATREKAKAEEAASFRAKFNEAVDHHSKAATEKYPQWFQPDPDDAKGNEHLENGQHLVARVIANGAPVKDGDQPMTVEEYASAVSAVRQKAGAFDRLAYRYAAATARIKELETELGQFRESEPKDGDGKGTATTAPDDSIEGSLNKLESDYSSEGP